MSGVKKDAAPSKFLGKKEHERLVRRAFELRSLKQIAERTGEEPDDALIAEIDQIETQLFANDSARVIRFLNALIRRAIARAGPDVSAGWILESVGRVYVVLVTILEAAIETDDDFGVQGLVTELVDEFARRCSRPRTTFAPRGRGPIQRPLRRITALKRRYRS